MRGLKIALIASVLVGVTAAAVASSDMVLTRTGDLYRLSQTEAGLVVNVFAEEYIAHHLTVPQTEGVTAGSLNLGVDEASGGIYVLWQEGEAETARVVFAAYSEGSWIGPMTLAGGDGTAAGSPQLLVFRHTTTYEEDGETFELTDSFLHLVWWSWVDAVDEGDALYVAVPLDDVGAPDFSVYDPVAIADLLGFGFHCEGIHEADGLAHPRLFVDPQTGNPHVFATDFAECVFQILELQSEAEYDPITERRRHRIVFGHSEMMAVTDDMPLASARVEVGHDLSLVIYWDGEASVDYVTLNDAGTSEVRSLPVGETLSRDQAVDLIRRLSH